MAKTKTKKIISAGLLQIEAIYPRRDKRDSERARAAKSRASSEAQKRLNRKYSYQKLELILAANFRPGDLWVTVTYDDEHLPSSRKQAKERFKYFLQKLRASRKKRLRPCVVASNVEHKHQSDSYWEDRRWHHHFVVNATHTADFEEIRRCWDYGCNIEIRVLDLEGEHSYEALARYMCKEDPDRVGAHCWSITRNAKRPEIEILRVESDETITAPKGARVLLNEGGSDPFCSWRVVKYLLPDDRPRRRRKRRR